jgi:hypothetical protein
LSGSMRNKSEHSNPRAAAETSQPRTAVGAERPTVAAWSIARGG